MAGKFLNKNPFKQIVPSGLRAVKNGGGGILCAVVHQKVTEVNPDTQKPMLDPKYAPAAELALGILAGSAVKNEHAQDVIAGWNTMAAVRLAVQMKLLKPEQVGLSGIELGEAEVGAPDRTDFEAMMERAMNGAEETVGSPARDGNDD